MSPWSIDTSITADSPAGTGTVDVTVTTPAGTSATSPADQFTYVAAPTVTAISPASGTAAGGTPVTITGTDFTGATAVDFGTVAATDVTVVNRHHDHGDQPGGHRHGGRDCDDAGGTSATSAADQFTYTAVTAPVGDGDQPDQRSNGRRHSGDDHRHGLHRRHGGRFRHDACDERERGERYFDHRP